MKRWEWASGRTKQRSARVLTYNTHTLTQTYTLTHTHTHTKGSLLLFFVYAVVSRWFYDAAVNDLDDGMQTAADFTGS